MNAVSADPATIKTITNEFSMLMSQVDKLDYVDIWAPSMMQEFFAIGLWSVINTHLQSPEAKERTCVHAPYTLNTGATLFFALPCQKTLSSYMHCRITAPVVFAIGGHLDTISGTEQQIESFQQIYKELLKCHLLTQEEVDILLNEQRGLLLYGDQLLGRFSK